MYICAIIPRDSFPEQVEEEEKNDQLIQIYLEKQLLKFRW